jgi:hypothetical protein
MMGHPPRFMIEIKVKKDEKMLLGIGYFLVWSIAVLGIGFLYLKLMRDETLE